MRWFVLITWEFACFIGVAYVCSLTFGLPYVGTALTVGVTVAAATVMSQIEKGLDK